MRIVSCSAFLLALLGAQCAVAAPTLDRAATERLTKLAVGEHVVIDQLPDAEGRLSRVELRRIDVYAPGARIVRVDASGEHEVPRSPRIQLIGASASGDVRLSLSFDPDLKHLAGVGTTSGGTFVIRGDRGADGLTLHSATLESTYPNGVVPRISSADDGLPTGRPQPSALQMALAHAFEPSGSPRSAVVAVDTDSELLATRFSNNTAAATGWIADLYATMNVMYERDLNVTLLQGATFLRVGSDPYQESNSPADNADLDEFGTYWQGHYGSISRAFAMLLSGKSPSGFSSSGIAWIDAYCRTQSNGGSYSVTQVFSSPQVDVGLSALVVGHELGHNFGAFHTHCTNAANGSAPVAANTIDQCYSGESDCYSGPTSCPSSGPGAPAGTVMSYCNLLQCGPTHQNVAQFHPTQIGTLSVLISQNTPQCINPAGDILLRNGFDP